MTRAPAAYGAAGLGLVIVFLLPVGSLAAHLAYELVTLAGVAAIVYGATRQRAGDALVVFVPGLPASDASKLAHRTDGSSTQELLDFADRAIYRRKQAHDTARVSRLAS
jgi:hypothetical protein